MTWKSDAGNHYRLASTREGLGGNHRRAHSRSHISAGLEAPALRERRCLGRGNPAANAAAKIQRGGIEASGAVAAAPSAGAMTFPPKKPPTAPMIDRDHQASLFVVADGRVAEPGESAASEDPQGDIHAFPPCRRRCFGAGASARRAWDGQGGATSPPVAGPCERIPLICTTSPEASVADDFQPETLVHDVLWG